MMNTYIALWAAAIAVFTVVEAATVSLVAVWFILGSLVALVLAICGVNFIVQWITFALLSGISLIAIRPIIRKQNNMSSSKDINNIIDKIGTVVEYKDCCKVKVEIDGAVWNSVMLPGNFAEVGQKVSVSDVRGNTLIIKGTRIDDLTGVDDCN